MNRVQQQMKKAKKQGMTPVDLLRMKEVARIQAQKMEAEAIDKAFLFMLAIPLNVLVNDYWEKSAKKRAPKFLAEVIKLYNAVQDGQVSEQELADLLDDMAGLKISAEWLKNKEEGEDSGRCEMDKDGN